MNSSTKKGLLIIGIVISVSVASLLLIIIAIALPWLPIMFDSVFSKNPPEPEIQYGEFPFTVIYEIDGRTFSVEDTLICEFNGFDWNEGVGKHRTWKRYLKNNPKEEDILIATDAIRNVYFFVGDAEYYMGEETQYTDEHPFIPHVYSVELNSEDTNYHTFASEEEILDYYNIKIISWEFSNPIENSFSDEPIEEGGKRGTPYPITIFSFIKRYLSI